MHLFKRITAIFVLMLVSLTGVFGFVSSGQKNAPSDFFSGTLDCAGVDDPGTRNPCRENGWLSYDTLSGYCVSHKQCKGYVPNKDGLDLPE